MALARQRQAARRVKDRWKAKQFYQVIAPATFNSHLLAETFADDPAKLMDRTIDTTMQELTGDIRQMHIKISFQVKEVLDNKAHAQYVGHSMTSDYVRRLTRRGQTKISAVFDLQTKDGSRIRVKPFAVTDRRCQTTQAQEIRRLMQTELEAVAKAHSLSGFLAQILGGEVTQKIYKDARKIHPLRRIEVAKAELVKGPAIELDETPIIVIKEDEPEAAEATEAVELTSDDSEDEAVEADEADSEE